MIVNAIAKEINLFKRKSESEKSDLQVQASNFIGGIFLTTNLSPPALPQITGALRKTFRPLSYVPRNMPLILDIKFVVECFTGFELLRAQVMILKRLFDDMYMGRGSTISVSQIIKIVDKMSKFSFL